MASRDECSQVVPAEVVRREVSEQKSMVNESLRVLEASLSPEEFEELARQELVDLNGKILDTNVFPDWLTERPDFQYVFPRFAEQSLDEFSLVAFAMSKDLKQRTSFDIDKTVSLMMRCPDLENLPPELCRTLTKSIRLGRYSAGSRICAAGDPAQMFYIVVHGRVELTGSDGTTCNIVGPGQCFGERALSGSLDSVHLVGAAAEGPSAATPQGSSQSQQPCSPSQLASSTSGAQPRRGTLQSLYSSTALLGSPQGRASAQRIHSFFEENPNLVYLLELGAQDYRATCKLFFQSRHHHMSKFLSTTVRLFAKWSKHRVNQVAPLLKLRKFDPGQVVQKSGDPADDFFILFVGACEVQREVFKTKTNRWPVTAEPELFVTPRGSQRQRRRLEHECRETKVVRSVHLATLGPGDYFGEEALIGFARRRTTVVARGVTEVLVLSKKDSANMFTPRMLEQMKAAHQALFTSDEDIMEKYDRETRLQQQYRDLKRSALGPDYAKRLESKRLTLVPGSPPDSLLSRATSMAFLGRGVPLSRSSMLLRDGAASGLASSKSAASLPPRFSVSQRTTNALKNRPPSSKLGMQHLPPVRASVVH